VNHFEDSIMLDLSFNISEKIDAEKVNPDKHAKEGEGPASINKCR
jgi:hypothetical protein